MFFLLLVAATQLLAATDRLERFTWKVDGVEREALVRLPAGVEKGGAPLVFAFHGHGGSANNAARSFAIHDAWAEAIVVYPEGLPTPGQLTDREGKFRGWQGFGGDQADRDLKFYDAMRADFLARYHADPRRVYAMGHSNGGAFTYLLLAFRGNTLAAVAPSAALITRDLGKLTAKPVLHLGSPNDPLVKFAWQERMIDQVLKLNGVGPRHATAIGYVDYHAEHGVDAATFLHTGGHRFVPEGVPYIVRFFQAHTMP